MQPLREPKPRAPNTGPGVELELVGDRPDDCDAETAFGELFPFERRRSLGIDPLTVVDDLDRERVMAELVGDRDEAAFACICVAHRVRDGLSRGPARRATGATTWPHDRHPGGVPPVNDDGAVADPATAP